MYSSSGRNLSWQIELHNTAEFSASGELGLDKERKPSFPLADNSNQQADNSDELMCPSFSMRGTRKPGNSRRETRSIKLDTLMVDKAAGT